MIIEAIRNKIISTIFVDSHKSSPSDFTRSRKLPFIDVVILIFRKSIKSLQIMLNEFALQSDKIISVTSSAFTQARKKLKHTAFIELNDDLIREYYKSNDFKTLYGFRVLAFDASYIILPKTKDIKNEFGEIAVKSLDSEYLNSYSRAAFQSCYDVLNNISVASLLTKGKVYEVNLASSMLDATNQNDLLLFDRAYASYAFLATLTKKNKNFIVRCPKKSFAAVQSLLNNAGLMSSTNTVYATKRHEKKIAKLGLPEKISIRFVKVFLPSGEIEILATSLMDEELFKVEMFQQLYSLRWGVETFFGKIKGRLSLENFSGKSAESIKQDFWSIILISNLETVITEDIQEQINNEPSSTKPEKTINKAVSFNVIKNLAFDLLYSDADTNDIVNKMTTLFRLNLNTVRKERKVPRCIISLGRSLNYQRRQRKHVF